MTMRTALHTAGSVEGALDGRLDSGSLWALNGPGPLDVRTGVVYAPGAPMAVLGTSATSPWAVTVNPGHVVGSKGISNGPYIACNDALTTVNLAVPPATNSRIDVIYAMQLDLAAIVNADGSTAAVLAAATGVAGAVPAIPAIPVGAVALAQVLIASTATSGTSGAGVTITTVFLWTATRGDPIPCRTQAERDAITVYDALQAWRLDTHTVETYNSGVTQWISSPPVCRLTTTVTGMGTSATTAVFSAINFNVETYDPMNLHDNVTNNTRITIALPGYYRIKGKLRYSSGTSDGAQIAVNGAGLVETQTYALFATGAYADVATDTTLFLTAGQYVELWAGSAPGAATISQTGCYFEVAFVRP